MGAGDEGGGDIGAHDFEDRGLNIGIGDSLNVTVSHVLVPNLEGFGTIRERGKVSEKLEVGESLGEALY